ncbi:MAG: hypothetical protein AAB393_10600, partial [Bacteroidota bacterium]
MGKVMDLIIKNGFVVSSERIIEADIAIGDGVIQEIDSGLSTKVAAKIVDASGKYILPGVIDVHAHFHDEPPYVDDLQALSRTAAFGGTTTILPFLFVKKGQGVVDNLKKAIDNGQRSSFLDFGFHPCMFDTKNQLHEIPDAIRLGV